MCRILEMAFGRRSRGRERSDVMRRDAILPLALFAALVLSAALGALAASGHFPHERRGPSFPGGLAGSARFGAFALTAGLVVLAGGEARRALTCPAAARPGLGGVAAAPAPG